MALNALRTALGRIGFSVDARNEITDAQGLDELEKFSYLTDTEVENLCKTIRRPGGTVDNPDAEGAGQPAVIPDHGIRISLIAVSQLKLMCYYLRFKQRTSRPLTAQEITVENVQRYREHKEWEKTHKDPTVPELTFKDWPRTIEAIHEHLRNCLGTSKIPLAYVVRDELDPPAGNDDEYETFQDELIARAPIRVPAANMEWTYTHAYLQDREKVYDIIAGLTREHTCWTYVRAATRRRDGRKAFLGLKNHYLGVNHVDNMASQAEFKLDNSTYNGETRRWNFEKYVNTHKEQHAIIESLVQHGHSGIDPRSKVRKLLNGIKTKELDVVKTAILSNERLRSDFDASVNLIQDFIKQMATEKPRSATIAAVKTGGDGVDWENLKPDMSVEDRFYKKKEYQSLSNAKKKGLKIKRQKRKGGNADNPNHKKKKTTDRQISALTARIAALETDDKEVEDKPKSDETDKNNTDNRTNKALKRKQN